MPKVLKIRALLASAFALLLAVPGAAADERAAVVQRHVDAYRDRNLNAFLDTFASDAVVIYEGMRFQGREQIREIYRLNFAPNAPKIRIRDSGGDEFIVWIQTAYVLDSGQELCCGYSQYTVEGGKITWLEVSGLN